LSFPLTGVLTCPFPGHEEFPSIECALDPTPCLGGDFLKLSAGFDGALGCGSLSAAAAEWIPALPDVIGL
jgi:hypothetical protein